ncbi:MAG: hypothetical protein AAB638_02630 [Patescibacteria group bacterium]
MKKILTVLLIVILGGVGFYLYQKSKEDMVLVPPTIKDGHKNTTYNIEEERVTLVNGKAETEIAPNSGSTITTEYFGNEATGDVNGDGLKDIAFVLTQDGGGTGIFYYVVVALNTSGVAGSAPGSYKGTNALYLGDRIAPQITEYRNGQFVVNYADRSEGEPFSTSPSIGVTKYIKVVGGKLVEVSS